MGWTEQQLAEASPAYLSALRWLILSESLWPDSKNRAWIDEPISPDLGAMERVQAAEAHQNAREALDSIRTLLFPKD
jgi:hypothetical protein